MAACLLLVTSVRDAAALGSNAEKKRELVVATVSSSVDETESRLAPIFAIANGELRAEGVELSPMVYGTHTALLWDLWDERVDFVLDQSMMALKIMSDVSGGIVGAVLHPDGALSSSVLIARSDSGVDELGDLVGHTVVFSKPSSSFGHILPRIDLGLDRLGLREVQPTGGDPLPGDVVGMIFTGDEVSPPIWLYRGRADFAVVERRALARLVSARPGYFRQIAETIAIPSELLIARSGQEEGLARSVGRAIGHGFDKYNGTRGKWLVVDGVLEQMLDGLGHDLASLEQP